MRTYSPKIAEINHAWHLLDAQNQAFGRLASEAVKLLMGKHKPTYSPNLDSGDFVVVINAAKVKITGAKSAQKKYYRHSGFPGGFREINLEEQMAKDPTKVIHHAVAGMLPPNKLKDRRLVRLKIFSDDQHPYEEKFKNQSLNAKN